MRPLIGLVLIGFSGPLAAQRPASTAPGAVPPPTTITAAAVARHLAVFAQDSMQGRTTPSPALERTAQYLATELERAGALSGDRARRDPDPDWQSHYSLPSEAALDYTRAVVKLTATVSADGRPVLSETGRKITRSAGATLTAAARLLAASSVPGFLGSNWTIVVTGRQTVASIRQVDKQWRLHENLVLYLPPAIAAQDSARERAVRAELAARSAALFVVSSADSSTFAGQVATARTRRLPMADMYRWGRCWTMELWEPAVRGILGAAGIDLARVRADTAPTARMVPLGIEFHAEAVDGDAALPATAPNVVGTVPGWDSTLSHQYVVVMVPMDQTAKTQGDTTASIGKVEAGGDNAVGLAGAIELARAFAQHGAQPRRSLLFVAVSGERQGTWGRWAFMTRHFSPWPVLTVLLDLAGEGSHDTVAVAGLGDIRLATDLPWIVAGHPELGVTFADAGAPFPQTFGGEPLPLPVAGLSIPGLAVRWSEEVSKPAMPAARAAGPDPERAARVLQMLYYLIAEVANGAEPPRWSDAARRRNLNP